jgi:hypothetical protein
MTEVLSYLKNNFNTINREKLHGHNLALDMD